MEAHYAVRLVDKARLMEIGQREADSSLTSEDVTSLTKNSGIGNSTLLAVFLYFLII